MIYYCHVPRTGGTTIAHLLENRFHSRKAATIGENAPASCLYGHFNYNPTLNGTWLTFIREPHARLTALYNYYLTKIDPTMTELKFLDLIKPNPMVSQLGSDPTVFDFIGLFENFEKSIAKLDAYLGLGTFKLRHTHKNNNVAMLNIPAGFLELDQVFYYDAVDLLTNV